MGIFRTKVDEKVDNSGWRIKIIADGGYTHQIVGHKWVPGGALLPRGRVWPVDVPETSCSPMVEVLGQQYNVGKKPIILYTYINHQKGISKQRQTNYTSLKNENVPLLANLIDKS